MLGERLKALREARGWSQSDLYRASGVAQGYISSIERGERTRVSGDRLQKLAAALDTTVDDLLNDRGVEDLTDPPLDMLRTVGADQEELETLARRWPLWSAARRRKYLSMLRTVYDQKQALLNEAKADAEKQPGIVANSA